MKYAGAKQLKQIGMRSEAGIISAIIFFYLRSETPSVYKQLWYASTEIVSSLEKTYARI